MAKSISFSLPVKLALLGLILAVIVLVAWFAPLERTLGENIRLVYVHGAWVWAGQIAYAAAALAGLFGLVFDPGLPLSARSIIRPAALSKNSSQLYSWSRVLGWTGLAFWWTYLPMSVMVMQINWGGIFWAEPRFQTPLAFGVAGLLLQAGLALLGSPRLTAAANLGYGVVLWVVLRSLSNVLHPDSPIAESGSARIQIFFVVLLGLALIFSAVLAVVFKDLSARHEKRIDS